MKSKFIAFLAFWPTTYAMINFTTSSIVFSNIGNENPALWLVVLSSSVSTMFLPTFWLFFGTVIYFLVQIFKNKIVPENKRLDWAAAIFFFGLISFPIFWHKYLRKR